ncbi:MAG: hypothetical protein ACQ5SW_07310 [Sphaerochaetaceae bacterium]
MKIGNPLDENNHVGPLIDKDAVKNYLSALERENAILAVGCILAL